VSQDKAQKLLQGGIKAARSGDKELARRAFSQVIKLQPENEAAWLGMATVAPNTKEKLVALRRLLQINPQNENALEALRRLGVPPERLLDTQTTETASDDTESPGDIADDISEEPEPAASSPFLADIEDEAESDEPLSWDDIGEPPLPGDDDDAMSWDDIGEPPLPGDDDDEAALWSDEPAAPVSGSLKSLRQRDDETEQTEPDVAPETGDTDDIEEEDDDEAPVYKTPQEAFAALPPPPQGRNGTPLPDEDALPQITRAAEELTQAYLDRVLSEYQMVNWERKNRGLAGAREHFYFLAQAGTTAVLAILLVGGGLTALILNSPEAQRVLFAPTWTPSPTPTVTPTATPGVTNTPSPTPDPTLTPSPTLQPSVTPYPTDPNLPPEPTNLYRPVGIGADLSAQVEAGVEALIRGDEDDAFQAFQDDIAASGESQTFWPYYYLVQLYLQQNQPEDAQDAIDEGEETLPQTEAEDYQPLVNVAQARVNLYRADEALEAGDDSDAETLLEEADDLLTAVIQQPNGLDRRFVEAYQLLAERHILGDDPESALQVIQEAINSGVTGGIYTDTRLRMTRARIYVQQEEYARALQELHDVLLINPFLEPALLLQAETALAANQPGLGVLFSEQYLLYYPGSVRGYQLLGEARRAENKIDLALNAFSRGLQGDPDDPAYLELLISRGNIYLAQQRYEDALADFTDALEQSDENPLVRVNRMEAAYFAGEYDIALEDADLLQESDNPNIPDGDVLLILGRIAVDEEENFSEAIRLIDRALTIEGLDEEQQPVAREYLARAYFEQNEFANALNAVDEALAEAETGSRHFLRGRILEEQGDLRAARDEYEFVLTWSRVYPYEFRDEALERYNDINRRLGDRRST
jgi:tetratricopeptide (TPR) repeat protein